MLSMHTSKYTNTNLGGVYIHKLGTQWASLLTPLKFLVCYSLLYWQWRSTEYDRLLQPLPMNGWWLRFHSFQHVLCSSSFILIAASSGNTPLSAMAQQIFSVFFRMDHSWQSSSKRIQHWGWQVIGKLTKQ